MFISFLIITSCAFTAGLHGIHIKECHKFKRYKEIAVDVGANKSNIMVKNISHINSS